MNVTPSFDDQISKIKSLPIDMDYTMDLLMELLEIRSPSGYTDHIVNVMCEKLEDFGVPYELTRRGAIRADFEGARHSPDRAVIGHLDTLGAMVKQIKPNGRLRIAPIGHWSSRFAEGARVTIFTDHGQHRGQILPLKASGHTFNKEIDSQPVDWENLEIRVDIVTFSKSETEAAGINVGDYIAIDPNPERTPTGFLASRHLDDKVGVACMMGAARAILAHDATLPVDCHLLFTISEEVGSGASAVLHGDVAEMLAVDNGTTAEGQNSSEFGATISMMDQTGPFDYHLTHKLLRLAREFEIPHQRDVFRYYRTDAAAAVEAGNDIRTGLLTFGIDASHGYERIHENAIESVARMIALYMQSPPVTEEDKKLLAPREMFPFNEE